MGSAESVRDLFHFSEKPEQLVKFTPHSLSPDAFGKRVDAILARKPLREAMGNIAVCETAIETEVIARSPYGILPIGNAGKIVIKKSALYEAKRLDIADRFKEARERERELVLGS